MDPEEPYYDTDFEDLDANRTAFAFVNEGKGEKGKAKGKSMQVWGGVM